MEALSAQLEALLYVAGKPQKIKDLAGILGCGEDQVLKGFEALKERLVGTGLVLIEEDGLYALGTHPDYSDVVEKMYTKDTHEELSKAAAETLAVILYYPEPTKADIEFIRGVNATYSLRSLYMRGLIYSTQKSGVRGSIYRPTIECLQYYGAASISELPLYTETRAAIEKIIQQHTNNKEEE